MMENGKHVPVFLGYVKTSRGGFMPSHCTGKGDRHSP